MTLKACLPAKNGEMPSTPPQRGPPYQCQRIHQRNNTEKEKLVVIPGSFYP